MSKRKPPTASKRTRERKIGAQPQRTKQDVVRSPNDNPLRAVATASTESLHDAPKQEAPVIERKTAVSQNDSSQTCPLAMSYVQAYQTKLFEMAQTNMQLAFEFAQRMAATRSPFEVFAVIAEFAIKPIDMYQKYSKELAELNTRRLTV
jgi:hypothetical protein